MNYIYITLFILMGSDACKESLILDISDPANELVWMYWIVQKVDKFAKVIIQHISYVPFVPFLLVTSCVMHHIAPIFKAVWH